MLKQIGFMMTEKQIKEINQLLEDSPRKEYPTRSDLIRHILQLGLEQMKNKAVK